MSSSVKTTFDNQIWNNNDASATGGACSTANADLSVNHVDIVQSGIAGSTQNDSTHITLASSASSTNNFYINNVVGLTATGVLGYGGGSGQVTGLITAYNGTTKVATVASWTNAGTQPTTGTAYAVYGTVVISSLTPGAVATVTGVNTHFTSKLAVGDGVYATYQGNGNDIQLVEEGLLSGSTVFINTVTSDTSLAVTNGRSLGPDGHWSTSTYGIVWYEKQWAVGDCGLFWEYMAFEGSYGSTPYNNPPEGGSWNVNGGAIPPVSNNSILNTVGWMALGAATGVDGEPRGRFEFQILQSAVYDFVIGPLMGYYSGPGTDGASYSSNDIAEVGQAVWTMGMSLQGFPSLDLTGPWLTNPSIYKAFTALPDIQDGAIIPYRYGSSTGNPGLSGSQGNEDYGGYYTMDPVFLFAPQSNAACYLSSFLQAYGYYGSTNGGNINLDQNTSDTFLQLDPRIGSVGYRCSVNAYATQPTQYVFNSASTSACVSLTGGACAATNRGDSFASRTDWTKTATLTLLRSRTFNNWGHDSFEFYPTIYKVGQLRGSDWGIVDAPPGLEDPSIYGDALQYGGPQPGYNREWQLGFPGTYASAPIIRWAGGANQYGYAGGGYAYGASDLTNAYLPVNGYTTGIPAYSITYSLMSTLDDHGGTDQFIIEHRATAVTSSATSIQQVLHFPQCATCTWSSEGNPVAYQPGSTAVTAASCTVTELESGNTTGSNPQAKYGLITNVVSPSTITCTDLGETAGSYLNGYTHAMSVCAGGSGSTGGAACGASVSAADWFVVSKIANGLSDTPLTTSLINPTGFSAAGYVGVQAQGSNSAVVYIDTVDSSTHGVIPNFTSTFSTSSGDYTLAGLTAGVYSVALNGTGVSGPNCASGICTVSSADTTIHFSGSAGTVAVSSVVGFTAYSSISGTTATLTAANPPGGTVTIDYWMAGHSVLNTALPTSSPYTATLDLTTLWDGPTQIVAVARDGAGNILGESALAGLTVANFGTTASITSPSGSGTLSGTVTWAISATNSAGIGEVAFVVDGAIVHIAYTSGTTVTPSYSLNTTLWPNGVHYLSTQIVLTGEYVGIASTMEQATFGNGATALAIRSNYHEAFLTPTQTLQLSPVELFTDGTTSSITSSASYSSANTGIATVSSGGLITGVAAGIANITISYGGYNTTVIVTVNTTVAFQHFTSSGQIVSSYQPGQSIFTRTLFNLGANDLSITSGLAADTAAASINAITNGFFLNPYDYPSITTLAQFESVAGGALSGWISTIQAGGFSMVGTGDDVARSSGELNWTLTTSWAPQAIQYDMGLMAASGSVISLEMQDEVGGAPVPSSYVTVNGYINASTTRPSKTWPPAALSSSAVFSAWLGNSTISDYG
jgi:hypothetical protein